MATRYSRRSPVVPPRRASRTASRRPRRAVQTALLVFTCAAAGYGVWRTTTEPVRPAAHRSGLAPAPDVTSPGPPVPSPIAVPERGAGTFTYSASTGPVVGRAGTLRRFKVAVEDGLGQDPNAFAAAVDQVLGDARGWTGGGQWRLQRVPKSAAADFTVFLASQFTSAQMCLAGGLRTLGYTACRLPGQVILNLTRWLTAVPDYGAPLAIYRSYALNHEVGHELGHGHEACPGVGRAAPVMQQQTFGLHGCVANGWPYLDGTPYTGPPVP